MNSTLPVEPVPEVDLQKYAGKWYDIAHFPSTFLNGCENITAEYTLTDKNYLEVSNRCVKSKNGKTKSISGKAFVVEGSGNSKLKVQFFWPFRADYWILDIERDYLYASIGGPTKDYAWILSRTPEPDEKIISKMIRKLERIGYDVSRFQRTQHSKTGK